MIPCGTDSLLIKSAIFLFCLEIRIIERIDFFFFQLSYCYLIFIDDSTCKIDVNALLAHPGPGIGVGHVNWLPTLTQCWLRDLILFGNSLSVSQSAFWREGYSFHITSLRTFAQTLEYIWQSQEKFKGHRSGGAGHFSKIALRSL